MLHSPKTRTIASFRYLLFRIVLLIVSVGCALLGAEQLYRFYIFGWSSWSFTRMDSQRNLGVSGLVIPSSNPDLIYELKPDLHTFFKGVAFDTTSDGLWDQPYSREKPANTYRIAVVGDSFTMASGVPIEAAYHSVIEKRLNLEFSQRRYELINFGVGGYCLRQYVAMVTQKAHVYHPDAVLVGFCSKNDHFVMPDSIFQTPYQVKRIRHGFFHLYTLDAVLRMSEKWHIHGPRLKRFFPVADPNKNVLSDAQHDHVNSMFAKLAEYRDRFGIPVIIVYMDLLHYEQFAAEIHNLAHQHGLLFIDASAAFPHNREYRYWINRRDDHPNATAHRMFADAILSGNAFQPALNGMM
ncbi:SGNH/GDSL hydrolase family protein [bacterium]|nr:SGNH/GDSL hydrolase family protein [candidate division CSSED10-310 bacterium]